MAGKTGTAELKTCSQSTSEGEASEPSTTESTEGCEGGESSAANTDAWFTAFAPAIHPRIAVCVLLVKDGAGGDTAAPVAREVMEAGPSLGPQRQTSSSAETDSAGFSGFTILTSSGRLSSEEVLILNSSIAPCVGPKEAVVSAFGSRPFDGTFTAR